MLGKLARIGLMLVLVLAGALLIILGSTEAFQYDIAGITVRAWREAQPFFRLHGFEPLGDQRSLDGRSDLLWRSSRWLH